MKLTADINIEVSIILVNYNTEELLIQCLKSVFEETINTSLEIIVVDNGSKNNCKEQILALFQNVIWIQLNDNQGFARANNCGIRIAKGKYILLLNTDTIILNNAIGKTVDLLSQHSEYAACGVQLLNSDGTFQISGAHIIKGGLNTLLPLPYLGNLIRYFGYRLNSKIPSIDQVSTIIDVDWIIGAYIMVRKEILKKSGLLDEDFFMYSEEIEWCSRLKKQGNLCLFGESKIIHIGGGSSSAYYNTTEWNNGKNLWNRRGRQVLLSNLVRIRKEFGVSWFLVIMFSYVIEIVIFFLGYIFESIYTLGKSKYSFRNFIEYTKNIFAILPFCKKILLNRPYFYKIS